MRLKFFTIKLIMFVVDSNDEIVKLEVTDDFKVTLTDPEYGIYQILALTGGEHPDEFTCLVSREGKRYIMTGGEDRMFTVEVLHNGKISSFTVFETSSNIHFAIGFVDGTLSTITQNKTTRENTSTDFHLDGEVNDVGCSVVSVKGWIKGGRTTRRRGVYESVVFYCRINDELVRVSSQDDMQTIMTDVVSMRWDVADLLVQHSDSIVLYRSDRTKYFLKTEVSFNVTDVVSMIYYGSHRAGLLFYIDSEHNLISMRSRGNPKIEAKDCNFISNLELDGDDDSKVILAIKADNPEISYILRAVEDEDEDENYEIRVIEIRNEDARLPYDPLFPGYIPRYGGKR